MRSWGGSVASATIMAIEFITHIQNQDVNRLNPTFCVEEAKLGVEWVAVVELLVGDERGLRFAHALT